MKLSVVFTACCLALLAPSHFAHGQSLEACSKAYAFIHIITNSSIMGNSRLLVLNDVNCTQGSNVVTTDLSAFCLSSDYLSYQVIQSQDMGREIPWHDTIFDSKRYSLSYYDVPYFEADYFNGINGSILTTNAAIFYRVEYTCTSLDYYTESELISYCTNSLGFPASLFEQ